MKIYQRMLAIRAFQTSLWTVLASGLLFILVDLSSHLWIFHSGDALLILSFSLAQLSKMLPMITGFSVLVGTLTLILHLHARGEITALRAAGLSKKDLFLPLLIASFAFMAINLANYEWLYPKASEILQSIKQRRRPGHASMQSLDLGPGHYLIYRDHRSGLIYDAFLVHEDEVIHCQTIDTTKTPPIAQFVDLFERSKGLVHVATKKSLPLTHLQYLDKKLLDATPPDSLAITHLTKGALWRRSFALALQSKWLLSALAPMAALLASAALPFRSRLQSRTRTYFFAVSMYLIYILLLNSSLFLMNALPKLPSPLLWLFPLPLALMYVLLERLENRLSS